MKPYKDPLKPITPEELTRAMVKFIDDLSARSTNPECIPLTSDQQAEFIRFAACTAVKLAESPAFAATRLSIAVQDYKDCK